MDLYNRIKKLERIHQIILNKSTGTPGRFAQKTGLARRTLYEYLYQLKAFGAEISYSRSIQSYYYLNDFEFSLWVGCNEHAQNIKP